MSSSVIGALQASKYIIKGCLPLLKAHSRISYSLRVNEQESWSSVSLSVTSSNLLTTSKILNTPRNTGTVHVL